MSRPAIDELTLKQIAVLFDQIASLAVQADRTFFYLGLDEDEERGLKLNSIRALVDRIGWMADLGSHKLPGLGIGPVRGDAESWLLPPSHRFDVEPEASNG